MDRDYLNNNKISFMDFTTTFCMIKGIPLPKNCIGAVIPDFFIN
jgi:hypothetical protein